MPPNKAAEDIHRLYSDETPVSERPRRALPTDLTMLQNRSLRLALETGRPSGEVLTEMREMAAQAVAAIIEQFQWLDDTYEKQAERNAATPDFRIAPAVADGLSEATMILELPDAEEAEVRDAFDTVMALRLSVGLLVQQLRATLQTGGNGAIGRKKRKKT